MRPKGRRTTGKGVVAVSTDSPTFHQDLTVGEAFALHPGARAVFANFHLGGCAHCAISEFETIEQVSEGYGIPLSMILDALNALPAMEPATVQKAS
jgi:hybrid cluster-associated redox disulfide protein